MTKTVCPPDEDSYGGQQTSSDGKTPCLIAAEGAKVSMRMTDSKAVTRIIFIKKYNILT